MPITPSLHLLLPLALVAGWGCATPTTAQAPAAPVEAAVPDARPEPVTLTLPGWTVDQQPGGFPNERITAARSEGAKVVLVRWWGRPEIDGGPMQVAERRPVEVAGQPHELLRTSMFEGQAAEVDVLFLRGEGWMARLSCRGCTAEQIEVVLAGVAL